MVKLKLWASTFHGLNLTYKVKRDKLPGVIAHLQRSGLYVKLRDYDSRFDDVHVEFLLPAESNMGAVPPAFQKEMEALGCVLANGYATTRVCPVPDNELMPTTALDFRVWKRVVSVTHPATTAEYHDYMNYRHGVGLGLWVAAALLKTPGFAKSCNAKEAQAFDLVRLSVEELGFSARVGLLQIYNAARAVGLELCPPVAGLLLAIECRGRLEHSLYMAMHPIDFMGRVCILSLAESVVKGEDHYVVVHDTHATYTAFDPDDDFVFVRPL